MFKKTLKTAVFLSSLAVMIGMAQPIKADAATNYAMATNRLNVRTGASTKYRSIDKLEKGEVVKVISTSGDWHKVQFDGNKTGWSSKSYLVSTNASAKSTVNVRTGASTKYRAIDKLSKGEKVKVISTSGDWHKVQFDGDKVGWSHKNYISKTGGSSTNSSNSSMNVVKRLTVKAYAYTGGGYTATGTKAKYGTLAVDPKVIPYGTKVYIKELDKVFTAEDCGGGIKGNKIDIYMNSSSACRNWGVRTITLQILK